MQTLALHMGINMETFLTLPTDPSAILQHDADPSSAGVVEEDKEEE